MYVTLGRPDRLPEHVMDPLVRRPTEDMRRTPYANTACQVSHANEDEGEDCIHHLLLYIMYLLIKQVEYQTERKKNLSKLLKPYF